ncbi:hypothetical protein JD77_00260 [Micromonospora olivasterospora]|uniref:Uncharacterized protein n=1 Tax=Micromonospora olivasterospora TaxID=1880 RepID=A0A562I3P9_MICOL|nr:hypothetical protein JD77_00260 [Micromonospora olivasterospora]
MSGDACDSGYDALPNDGLSSIAKAARVLRSLVAGDGEAGVTELAQLR